MLIAATMAAVGSRPAIDAGTKIHELKRRELKNDEALEHLSLLAQANREKKWETDTRPRADARRKKKRRNFKKSHSRRTWGNGGNKS